MHGVNAMFMFIVPLIFICSLSYTTFDPALSPCTQEVEKFLVLLLTDNPQKKLL